MFSGIISALGVVKNITDYGAFVDLGGLDGLLHITDISWSRVTNPSEHLNLGDEIEVKVLNFDKEKLRVSLGLKQIHNDPWENVESSYSVGGIYEANVSNIADYGCFAQLEDGIEGLIHLSELDWTSKNIHPSKVVEMDEKIKVMILEIDHDKRRISLGLKQTKPNPWDVYETLFAIDTVHEGTVVKLKDKAGIVSMAYGVEAYCPAKHMKKEDGNYIGNDEKAEFKILEFNKDGKKILISHTKVWGEVEARKVKSKATKTRKAVQNINDASEKTTLGDLDALAALKDKMDNAK